VAKRLSELMKCEVALAKDSIGADVREHASAMKPGSVLLLENVRFHPEEEANDPAFAKALIADSGATVFVNDAFGTAHRAHASTAGVAPFVKQRVAGLLMDKEIHYLGMALASPPQPYIAIIGGAKVSDKITVIENLLPKVDTLLIGGGMAYTFFKALGYETGKSLVEDDKVILAGKLLDAGKGKILLPFDHVVASAFKADAETKTLSVNETPEGWMGLDIGPETVAAFSHEIAKAALVLWNGPMGVFEMKPFTAGTFAVAKALADSKATTIVGGGDSVAAISEAGLMDKITHVSTGGGASLEFLGGDTLPGVECLDNDPGATPLGG
jgi:3-phosphoglycerate kinase